MRRTSVEVVANEMMMLGDWRNNHKDTGNLPPAESAPNTDEEDEFPF